MPVVVNRDFVRDLVRGEPHDVLFEMRDESLELIDTAGWTVAGALRWDSTEGEEEVALEDDSALAIDAGVISGQIQPDAFEDIPEGRKTDLVVKTYSSAGAEPLTQVHPCRIWVL